MNRRVSGSTSWPHVEVSLDTKTPGITIIYVQLANNNNNNEK